MNKDYIIKKLKQWNPWWSDSFFYNNNEKILTVIYQKQLYETRNQALKRYNRAKDKYPDWHNEIDCAYWDRFIAS